MFSVYTYHSGAPFIFGYWSLKRQPISRHQLFFLRYVRGLQYFVHLACAIQASIGFTTHKSDK